MAVEQLQEFTNNATTTMPSAITSGDLSITVATGTGALFPSLAGSEFFIATLVNTIALDPGFGDIEIIKVTARSGDVMTVVRAQEGTAAHNYPSGALFELRPTAQAFNNIYTEVLELETTKAPLASPVFTGNPTAPTPSLGDNDTSIATTAFVAANPANGSLIGVQIFTANGTYTPTTGTTSVVVEAVGGGGGSGGSAAPSGTQCSAGQGGGGGSYGKGRYTSSFSGASVTIGAGGTAGAAGGSGGVGGVTSFGALLSCPGGIAGAAGPALTPPAFGQAAASRAADATGGNIVSFGGSQGNSSTLLLTTHFESGKGGDSYFGQGGSSRTTAGAGVSGSGYGAGAGGGASAASGAAQTGAAGQPGIVIVYEYR